MISLLRRRPVACFILLAFGISYLIGGPLLMALSTSIPSDYPLLRTYGARLLVVWGPGLAAIAVAANRTGRAGVVNLLGRLAPAKRDLPWVALVLAASALTSTAALLLAGVEANEIVVALRAGAHLLLAHFLLQLVVVAAGEELGWRGWLLPQLCATKSRLVATLLTATVWTIWHAPLLFTSLVTTGMFILGAFGLSVIFTALWAAAKGRVFVVVVAHASVNAPLFFWSMLAPADGRAQQAWFFQEAAYAIVGMALVFLLRRRIDEEEN
jgi:membrane protease YdiL (CAAX protease family)